MPTMRSIRFIASSSNFSTFAKNVPAEHAEDKPLEYEGSDDGTQVESILSDLQGDQLLLNLLTSLDTRDKVVLLYQVLREAGYNLEHEECAKTLNLSRSGYVLLVKNVKKKCFKILRNQKVV